LRLYGPVLAAFLLVGLLPPGVAHGQSNPPIRPQASSLQGAGSTFWVEVAVGSDQVPVQDLFGMGLTMTYDTSRVDVLDDEAGSFLGEDVVYSSNVDPTAGTVGVGISRKSGAGGVDGAGVVARVEVQIESDVPDGDTLTFRFPEVNANDPAEASIALDARSRGVTVGTAVPMQPAVQVISGETDGTPAPGDTVAVDVNVGSSPVPVSDLFGTSFTWTFDPSKITVISDAAGPFLGGDPVYSSNLDATNGELGIGVSQKAGANGADETGSVARVEARIDPDVAEGTPLSFGVSNPQARNPADSSIAISTADETITANAIPGVPPSLGASAAGPDVELTWTAPGAPDLQRYRIYRDTAPIDSAAGPAGLTALDSSAAGTTTFVDSTGTPGTTYYYRVTAVDALGSESGFSGGAQANPETAPTGTADAATTVTASSATLNATVNPGGDTTRVYFDLENSATGDSSVYAADTLTTTLLSDQSVSVSTPDTLKPATDYAYEVSAANGADSTTIGTVSFTTPDATSPANLTLDRPAAAVDRQPTASLDVTYSYVDATPDTTTITLEDGAGNVATFGVNDSGYAGDGTQKTVTLDLAAPDEGDLSVDGTYDVTVTATDSSANAQSVTTSGLVTVDGTAPSVTVGDPIDGAVVPPQGTIAGSASAGHNQRIRLR
jgi:hypothetical protein